MVKACAVALVVLFLSCPLTARPHGNPTSSKGTLTAHVQESTTSGLRDNMTSTTVTVNMYADKITNQQRAGKDSETFHHSIQRRMANNPCFDTYIANPSNVKHFTVKCRAYAVLGCFQNISRNGKCRPVFVSYGTLRLIQDCECDD